MALKKLHHSPMGWNSWDCFGGTLYEQDLKANIDYVAENLLQLGYEYIVIDGGWYSVYDLPEGQKYPVVAKSEKKERDIRLDANGRYDPSELFFPSGIKAMAEYAHSKGLKFGLHLMRGICRKAVENNYPIEGTEYTAQQIADKENICVWSNLNYGVDMSKPGAQEYYDSLIRKMADWKIDFIKYDDITAHPDEIEAVMRAIDKVNYPIVLSLSPGGKDTTAQNMGTYQKATALRVTPDIWDNDLSMERSFEGIEKYYAYSKMGFYLDLDMLCLGHLRLNFPKYASDYFAANNLPLPYEGAERMCQLSEAQQRSFITVRAISASPLLIGSDLLTIDDFALSLVTNKDMIECNQMTQTFKPLSIAEAAGFSVWQSDAGFIAVFNRSGEDKVFDLNTLKPFINTDVVWDVWNKMQISTDQKVTIVKNDVLFIKLYS